MFDVEMVVEISRIVLTSKAAQLFPFYMYLLAERIWSNHKTLSGLTFVLCDDFSTCAQSLLDKKGGRSGGDPLKKWWLILPGRTLAPTVGYSCHSHRRKGKQNEASA